MQRGRRLWINKCKDIRGIPLEDVVLLCSNEQEVAKGAGDYFIGSFKNHDGLRHSYKQGGYRKSVGAVFSFYREEWADDERIIALLCDTLQAMYNNPKLTAKKVIQELRKIDVFYYGAFPQVPGDHKEQEMPF